MNRIIANSIFQEISILSPKDIWKLYDEYLARTTNRLGIDVTQVIRFESMKEMESMLCTKCPLYGTKAVSEGIAELEENVSRV